MSFFATSVETSKQMDSTMMLANSVSAQYILHKVTKQWIKCKMTTICFHTNY